MYPDLRIVTVTWTVWAICDEVKAVLLNVFVRARIEVTWYFHLVWYVEYEWRIFNSIIYRYHTCNSVITYFAWKEERPKCLQEEKLSCLTIKRRDTIKTSVWAKKCNIRDRKWIADVCVVRGLSWNVHYLKNSEASTSISGTFDYSSNQKDTRNKWWV